MLYGTRIQVNPPASLESQRLQISTEREPRHPAGVHSVVTYRELLEHQAATPDGADAIIAPLAATEL